MHFLRSADTQADPVWSKNQKHPSLKGVESACDGLGQVAWVVITGGCGRLRWVGGGFVGTNLGFGRAA